MPTNSKYKPLIEEVRFILLDLHKRLIDIGRVDYEQKHGNIQNPGDWVRLLIGDPFFNFLHPFSKLITSLDQLLEITWPMRELDAKAVHAEVENLIGDHKTTPHEFRTRYLDMLQRDSEMVLILSKLKTALQKLPEFKPDQMLELLNVRSQWTSAHKLTRPTKPGNS